MKKWNLKSTDSGPDLRLFKARMNWMENPRNGVISPKVVLSGPDASNTVILTSNQEIVFVKQYRFGISDFTLELPGGLVESGENPIDTAIREMKEETGYASDEVAFLGKIGSNPVFMDCWIYHYVAINAIQKYPTNQDEGEDIETILISKNQTLEMLKNGSFVHPHTTSALSLFFLNH
jgi:ADP-ribose pyrophosphatase